jgi:signal transduction histidine kinase
MSEPAGRRLPGRRRLLRGLRAQLLLWTILPLTVVLIVLSLAGVARHRHAMTRLIEERDRGLAIAEANRLGREIAQLTADLTQLAAALPASPSAATLAFSAEASDGARLALFDANGALQSASPTITWVNGEAARALVARTATERSPHYATDFPTPDAALLLIATPVSDGGTLVAGLSVETLSLSQSDPLVEGDPPGAVLVLDQVGRRIHHHDPARLIADVGVFAGLPAAASGSTYVRDRSGRELLVSYARIEPLGWTLIAVEDVRAITAMGVSVVEALPLLLLFIAVVALLAVSLGVLNVVRPLQELDRRAAQVAWGDFSAIERPVGGVQEIEDLRMTLAQMAERIQSYQSGMRDYLSAITRGQEAERNRLAHELHDVTIQGLIALKQRCQMALKVLDRDPTRATARLIGDLRPIYLEDLGFAPALEMLARQMEEQHGLNLHLTIQGAPTRLAPDLELAAYRIVQQALTNVATHAQARNAWLEVAFAPEHLTLVVRDDGIGFTPPEQPADLTRQGHFGLMGMRERALLHGGQITITSAPGQGTTVVARLPLRGIAVRE